MIKTSARIAGVRAEIRTERLPNTSIEPYRYISLHGELISFRSYEFIVQILCVLLVTWHKVRFNFNGRFLNTNFLKTA
jgi:hypothetical protein